MTYRIVDTDNLGGDYPDEKFIGPEFDSLEEAEMEAGRLNHNKKVEIPDDVNSPRYYKVVEMPYELQPGFEP